MLEAFPSVVSDICNTSALPSSSRRTMADLPKIEECPCFLIHVLLKIITSLQKYFEELKKLCIFLHETGINCHLLYYATGSLLNGVFLRH